MKVLVDLDGVLGDIHETWYNTHNHTCLTCMKPLTCADVVTWDIHKYVACGKDIYSYLDLQGIYRNMPVIKDAIYGTLALQEMGLQLYVVTHSFNVNAIVGKHAFMQQYFSHIPYDCIIHAKDKSMITGDFIIDDYLGNLIGDDRIAVLFNSHHNQEQYFTEEERLLFKRTGIRRVSGWEEIVEKFKIWIS